MPDDHDSDDCHDGDNDCYAYHKHTHSGGVWHFAADCNLDHRGYCGTGRTRAHRRAAVLADRGSAARPGAARLCVVGRVAAQSALMLVLPVRHWSWLP